MVRRVIPTGKTPSTTVTTPPRRPTGTTALGGLPYHKFPINNPPPTPQPPAVDPTPPDERQLATILDKTIPMVFGARRVRGLIGAYSYSPASSLATLGVIFARGEQDSISTSTTYVNGEALNAIAAITSEVVHTGDGSTALSSLLTGMTGWTAADTTLWKAHAHAVFRIDCRVMRVPADGQIEADLGGMLVDASWRSGGSSSVATTNPVEVAYELNTNASYRGVSSAKIDTDSWEAVANWCDEVMSDASARYEYNGIVTNRDPASGVADVLSLPLAYEYIGDDGLIHLWCEMAPPPITGEWSATASATITEDSTAGEATTELTAGDRVYVGTDLRTVASITDDDTVVLDSAVTVSGVRVRTISPVDIEKHNWAQPPSAHEASKLSTPDKYRVRFSDGENRGSHEVLSSYGAGTDKIGERHLDGCTSATVAARHAETTLKVEWLQPWYWQGTVWQDIGAQLDVGDIVLFDDDVLTQQAARVIPPLVAKPDGTYVVNLREYDPSAYSDSTDTTDTVPSLGTAWAADGVPVFTQINTIYSGTEYYAVSYDGSGRQYFGDSSIATTVDGTQVRLPNNVPLYGLKTGGSTAGLVMCDSSDRIVVGDGSEDLYLNASSTVTLPTGVSLSGGWGSKTSILSMDGSNNLTINGSISRGATQVKGTAVSMNGIAYGAGLPSLTDRDWLVYRDTSASKTYLLAKYGATTYAVELT